jgi:hypothetical protein
MKPGTQPKRIIKHDPPKSITVRELFGSKGRETHFWGPQRAEDCPLDSSQFTHPERNIWHNDFLAEHSHEIKSFADVGCALPRGAPTTIDARSALPKGTRVIAIDVIGNVDKPGDFSNPELSNKGIEIAGHSIVSKPLSQPVDALRMSNVVQFMRPLNRRRAVVNAIKSVREGGYLLNQSTVYRRKGNSLEVIWENPNPE